MAFTPRFHRMLPYVPAMATGILLSLSFPGPDLSFLAFIALTPLVVSVTRMDAARAFKAGFIAGCVHYFTLVYWLVPTLCIFGGLNFLLSLSCLVLLCFYLSLYPALFAFILKRLSPPEAVLPLAGAATWTGLEYARTHMLTGFPWGVLGYSQYGSDRLVQTADIFGVLGISFILVLTASTLALVWTRFHSFCPPGGKTFGKQAVVCAVYTLALLFAAHIYGARRILETEKLMARAKKPVLAIVQGNIRQDLKWSEVFKLATVEKYRALSMEAAKTSPRLIIWPETALPFYYGHNPVLSEKVDAVVKKTGTPLLMGSPAAEPRGSRVRYYNRVYMLDHRAQVSGTYDKTHLVPFGEYVPFQDLLFFIEKITEEAGNFSPGDTAFLPLAFDSHHTGVLICFEILFPRIASRFVLNGADILTTVTNDAWFGRTSAARQHFSIAVLRAVENRRSLARAANTGISGFVDPLGRILHSTALFEDAVISAPLPALELISFYTRFGDVLPLACLIAIGAAFMVKELKNFKRRTQP